MFEKIKNMFKEKDEKKKIDNLVAFLIILVVTLILVNKILKGDSSSSTGFSQNQTGTQLVDTRSENTVLVNSDTEYNMEKKLEDILSKMSGVRKS